MKFKGSGFTFIVLITAMLILLASCKEVKWKIAEDGMVNSKLLFGDPLLYLSASSDSQGKIKGFWLLSEYGSLFTQEDLTKKDEGPDHSDFYVDAESEALRKLATLLNPYLGDFYISLVSHPDSEIFDIKLYTLHFTPFNLKELSKHGFKVAFDRKRFEIRFPKVFLKDTKLDSEALTLEITFPWEVEMANSMDVSGKTVRWVITRKMLKDGVVLKTMFKQ